MAYSEDAHFDRLQDERAEHRLETGDLLTALEYHKLTTPDATHGERADDVNVASGFPLRAMVIHGRPPHKAGRDGRDGRPQSTEGDR